MDNIAVIFAKDGIRICHGINPDDYKNNPNVLINPVFPKGVPPHMWQRIGNEIKVIEQDLQQDIKKEDISLKNKILSYIKSIPKRDLSMVGLVIFAVSVALIIFLSL